MEKSILEQKLALESELVRNESMRVLKDFEEIENCGLEDYSSDDSESSDE
jgi:hypothetical protein